MCTAIDNLITIEAPDASFNKISGTMSVLINPKTDEVQWHWTHLPNGDSYVSGYTIIKKECYEN